MADKLVECGRDGDLGTFANTTTLWEFLAVRFAVLKIG